MWIGEFFRGSLNIASGVTETLGGQIFNAGTIPLPKTVNRPQTGFGDTLINNPLRNIVNASAITGSFYNYMFTGDMPGTSQYFHGQLYHQDFNSYFLDTTPGCWGFGSGMQCYDTQHGVWGITAYLNGGGGTNLRGTSFNSYSVGDHIDSENYINSFGGSIDGGGPEGTKGVSYFVSEPSNTWTGTVASGHGGVGQTTIYAACTNDCGGGNYGVKQSPSDQNAGNPASLGQGMIVTDEQVTTASAQCESVTGWSGETPGTLTCNVTSGAINLAVSTCYGTIGTNLTPTTNPIGTGSVSETFNVTLGSGSGSCVAGQLIQFSGTNHEQEVITSVGIPSGGVQSVTVPVRFYHESGSYIFENANRDAGLFGEIAANTTGSLTFPFEVLGVQSVSGSTAVFWWASWYSGSGGAIAGFPYGHLALGTVGTSSLSNTGGTVTFNLYQNTYFTPNIPAYTVINHASAIYISGATNSAFDGPCTNVTVNLSTNPSQVTCTESASSGQTSTNANISLTDSTQDNPYGNSRVNFYQGAMVIDPQDPDSTVTVNGIVNPVVDGKEFIVESNEMPLSVGDGLVEHHSAAQFHIIDTVQSQQNPICYTCYGLAVTQSGVYGNGGSTQNNDAISANNTTPTSNYTYFGGTMTPTHTYSIQGLWQDFIYSRLPPTYGGDIIRVLGCPPSPSGCNDSNYYYNLFTLPSDGSSATTTYYPDTNTMEWMNDTNQFFGPFSMWDGLQLQHLGSRAYWGIWETSWGCGLGASYFCVQDSRKVYTWNNTLDDGNGNANIKGTLTVNNVPFTAVADFQVAITAGTSSATCSTPTAVTVPNLTTTMALNPGYSADPTTLTGWVTNSVSFKIWPASAGTADWMICSNTGAAVSYSAITFNVSAR